LLKLKIGQKKWRGIDDGSFGGRKLGFWFPCFSYHHADVRFLLKCCVDETDTENVLVRSAPTCFEFKQFMIFTTWIIIVACVALRFVTRKPSVPTTGQQVNAGGFFLCLLKFRVQWNLLLRFLWGRQFCNVTSRYWGNFTWEYLENSQKISTL
jgi:hypothetical protein